MFQSPLNASEALHWCLGVACPVWHEKDEKDEKVHRCLRALARFSMSEFGPMHGHGA